MDWYTVVIGGGCNGLAAASLMARQGRQTLLLEQRSAIGGLSGAFEYRTGQWIEGLRPIPGGSNLELLRPLGIQPEQFDLPDDSHTWTYRDRDGHAVDPSAEEDYIRYQAFVDQITPLLQQVFGAPARRVSVRRLIRTLRGVTHCGFAASKALLRMAPLSAKDFLDEFFTSSIIKGALATPMLLRTMGGPWSPFGALQLMLHECSGGYNGVVSGSQLIQRLHATALASGVAIQTNQEVIAIHDNHGHTSLDLDNGTKISARTVIAACSRKLLFDSLLDPVLTSDKPELRARGTCAILAVSADGWPSAIQSRRIGCVLDMTEMEQAFDHIKRHSIPNQQALMVSAPAPQNKGYAVRIHALQSPQRPVGGWTLQAKELLEQRVLKQLYQHLPELSGRITQSYVWTPDDLANEFAVPGGHLWHFERDLDQLSYPPTPSRPRGVYWGNAQMESGRVCAAGIAAARDALSDRNRQ